MSVGLTQETEQPEVFTYQQLSQGQQEMREFSFGKSTPPELDADPGSTLNIFYAKTAAQSRSTQQILVKEESTELLIKTDEP